MNMNMKSTKLKPYIKEIMEKITEIRFKNGRFRYVSALNRKWKFVW